MAAAIVWLRQDFRLTDNPALYYAAQQGSPVIPVYIFDEHAPNPPGGAQRWWLHHSLQSLQASFAKYQLKLVLKRGQPQKILHDLIKHHAVDAIYWNHCYEPAILQRDKLLQQTLQQRGIAVRCFNASLLNAPDKIKNLKGEYFRVFTPYWKACCDQIEVKKILPKPASLKSIRKIDSDNLGDWQLLPKYPDWSGGIAARWQPGEAHAVKHLRNFIGHALKNYAKGRDFPALDNTSHLSPYLHFGEISPWQIWHAIKETELHHPGFIPCCERFLTELGWREFSYYLLYHFPELPSHNFRRQFDRFAWQHNPATLQAWQQGKTGYPIVDAGMRELWQTGYMHNRVRMITASFLTKDLLQDWRTGAAWFWDTLVDADLANNSASWQWVAGSGADAAPYFRIFNPVLQSEKFDPQGEYIRRWVPELSHLPAKYVHQPGLAPDEVLRQAKIVLGQDYPLPLIDHAAARKLALEIYKKLR